MTKALASFRGILFDTDTTSEDVSWRHQTSEFVTGQEPQTRRFKTAPQKLSVEGFLVGPSALLNRELLLRACAEKKPGKLIHPMFGIRQVVCLGYRIETLGSSSNSYRFRLEFVEEGAKEKSKMAEFKDYTLDLLADFITFTTTLRESVFLLEEAAAMLLALDDFVRSQNGIGLISSSGEKFLQSSKEVKKIFRTPKKLFNALNHTATSASSFVLDDLPANDISGFFLAMATNENGVDGYKETITRILDHITDPAIFTRLWDLSLAAEPHKKAYLIGGMPSLVASYHRYGNLNHAKEFAHAAKQPFSV